MNHRWRRLPLAALCLALGCSAAPHTGGDAARGPNAAPPPTGASKGPAPVSWTDAQPPGSAAATAGAATASANAAAGSAPAPSSTSAYGPVVAAPPDYASCQAAPAGMVCIPGGPAVIGSNDHFPMEKPRHEVEVSTFYIDKTEVTNKAYEQCEQAGGCKKDRQVLFGWGEFMKPDSPAIAITWEHANAYCQWAGKRLPTEAEWEKVSRGGPEGRLYPWGNEPASCERAQYAACKPDTTKAVCSFPPGAYGVCDMAGNGYEWVNDWDSACYQGCGGECGADCQGRDPQGPCGGGPFCGWRKKHILKGGSWYWPAEMMRGAWRRAEISNSGAHRLSFRCASSTPWLTTWPPLTVTDPPPTPPDPSPPSPAELSAFHDLVEDVDIFKVPLCTEGGGAKIDCREAFSYVTTNETSQYLWVPYLRNAGGGYVGVGADQAYSIVALARSQWAWLFDYDPAVVRLHYIIRAIVLAKDSPEAFVKAFDKDQASEPRALIERSLGDNPAEREATLKTLDAVRASVQPWYRTSLAPNPKAGDWGWLRHPEHYRYVRLLYQQSRIAIIKGNLLTDKAMPSIAKSARRLGVSVRLLYVSNADDQWDVSSQYRANIAALPFDERSVVLRTILPRWRARSQDEPWDYLVHGGIAEQLRIVHPGWQRTWWFAKDARRDPDAHYLLTYGLAARTARDEPAAHP